MKPDGWMKDDAHYTSLSYVVPDQMRPTTVVVRSSAINVVLEPQFGLQASGHGDQPFSSWSCGEDRCRKMSRQGEWIMALDRE